MEIKVLTNVHKITCPHCGKEIFLLLAETKAEEEKTYTVKEFKAETPMDVKKRLFEWINSLEIGTTFTVTDIRKDWGVTEYSGTIRALGNILHSLVRQGYLEIADRVIGEAGRPKAIYKVVKKLPL